MCIRLEEPAGRQTERSLIASLLNRENGARRARPEATHSTTLDRRKKDRQKNLAQPSSTTLIPPGSKATSSLQVRIRNEPTKYPAGSSPLFPGRWVFRSAQRSRSSHVHEPCTRTKCPDRHSAVFSENTTGRPSLRLAPPRRPPNIKMTKRTRTLVMLCPSMSYAPSRARSSSRVPERIHFTLSLRMLVADYRERGVRPDRAESTNAVSGTPKRDLTRPM